MTEHMENDKEERKWKVLRSEYLFRRPWLTVRQRADRLPGGGEIPEYYVLEYPDWVNTIARTCTGEFVFVRQYRAGARPDLLRAVRRRARSSRRDARGGGPPGTVGGDRIRGGQWSELMVVSANPSTQTNLTHCFVATDVERISEQHLESTEDLTVHLLTPEQVRDLLLGDRISKRFTPRPCGATSPRIACCKGRSET